MNDRHDVLGEDTTPTMQHSPAKNAKPKSNHKETQDKYKTRICQFLNKRAETVFFKTASVINGKVCG